MRKKSVKLKVRRGSTILHPSNTTKFAYKLVGELTDSLLSEVESLSHYSSKGVKAYEVRKIVGLLVANGVRLEFDSMCHPIASANFTKIDSSLPQILSEGLIEWFSGGDKEIPKICDKLEVENKLKFPCDVVSEIYHYKIKKFLTEVALGMKPGTEWTGQYDAAGGFIVIEDNGDVVCFHMIDKNLLEDYLFENTYLDTPSSSKFGSYGGVYKEDGVAKIDLCLQIRFHDKLKI